MVYADYSYYTDTFLGNAIAEADFPRLAKRASDRIDILTRSRAVDCYAKYPAPVRDAVCAIAEILQQGERGNALTGEAVVRSETTGKHSVTYAAVQDASTETGQAALNARINAAAWQYLAHTGILYRGVETC